MILLGIETSCDDTSVAIVEYGNRILSLVSSNQNEIHQKYGGIFPELASRKHLEIILPILEESLQRADMTMAEIDAVSVTTHPGLIGSLLIGLHTAKTLAYSMKKPLISVSHLKAHFYSLPMSTDITYPFIGVLVSGGHTLLTLCHSPLEVEVIGTTLDDACGECFDKVAKHFDMGYPGGPAIEKLAKEGDENLFQFPQTTLNDDLQYSFSYSGLKTAVIYHHQKYKDSSKKVNKFEIEDIAASFQKAALEILIKKTLLAAKNYQIFQIGVCGGVSANDYLKKRFFDEIKKYPRANVFFPPFDLCTDNAAMIAGLAYEYYLDHPERYTVAGDLSKPNIDHILNADVSPKSFKLNKIL